MGHKVTRWTDPLMLGTTGQIKHKIAQVCLGIWVIVCLPP